MHNGYDFFRMKSSYRKSTPLDGDPIRVRATISLHPRVKTWASEMCEEKGYDNFSAYVADLIRRDKGISGPMRQAA
jgi:hypothetical protein